MHFAYFPPWWLNVIIALAVAAAVFLASRRPLTPLSTAQRVTLVVFRASSLMAIILLVLRPIALLPPVGARDAIVPVLVDVSRSMRVADADGQTRIARAAALLKTDLLPALSPGFVTELYAAGDTLVPAAIAQIDRLPGHARPTRFNRGLPATS